MTSGRHGSATTRAHPGWVTVDVEFGWMPVLYIKHGLTALPKGDSHYRHREGPLCIIAPRQEPAAHSGVTRVIPDNG